LQLLLSEFADVFTEPTGLPPPRPFDHRIHLLPSTPPIAARPYRYPQLLKDEIEKQCDDMLRQGIIRTSTSPFSAPVLLVRKKDKTWRFCVDYRELNSKTMKDKFLIPIVDELLDKLKGARFFTKLDRQDSVPDAPWPLRVLGHGVRAHQRPLHVLGADERRVVRLPPSVCACIF
jgi:hypothetical protein